MKYINNEFYTEVNNPKYTFNDENIFKETSRPKSLETKYEGLNGGKLEKNLKIIELDDGSLQIVDLKNWMNGLL